MNRSPNQKVVIITGATGSVGRAIIGELRQQPDVEIRYLTRSPQKSFIQGAKAYGWNPSLNQLEKGALNGVTHVINLAGASIAHRWTSGYKQQVLSSRLESLACLYRHISELETDSLIKVVSASAIGIYASDLELEHSEQSDHLGDSFLAHVVKEWEAAAFSFAQLDKQVSCVRLGIVLSTQSGALQKLLGPARLGLGSPLGSGKQWQSWIHLEDAARLFIYAMELEAPGVINAVAPEPVRAEALSTELSRLLGRPQFLPAIPAYVLRCLLGEMSAVVLESQKVLPKVAQNQGFSFRFNHLTEALEDLLSSNK